LLADAHRAQNRLAGRTYADRGDPVRILSKRPEMAERKRKMEAVEMQTYHKIFATGKLKAFLDARASGASQEILKKLSAEALDEQKEQRTSAAPHLSLVSHNPDFEG
jgi:hypothetical protein